MQETVIKLQWRGKLDDKLKRFPDIFFDKHTVVFIRGRREKLSRERERERDRQRERERERERERDRETERETERKSYLASAASLLSSALTDASSSGSMALPSNLHKTRDTT